MDEVETFVVGAPLPRVRNVTVLRGFRIMITWDDGVEQDLDLKPALYRDKIYAPLREDDTLFRTATVTDDGFAIAWNQEGLDMASTTITDLARQVMSPTDFSAFMKRNGYTLDSVAAELGISRRLAAYYAKRREVPRYIALACRYLERATTT